MNTDGEIIRRGNTHIVRVGDKERVFEHKRIFLPNELHQAALMLGDHGIIIGGTGYSSIKSENLQDWGLNEGEYENACYLILAAVIERIRNEFPLTAIRIVHGSSSMGIDNALMKAARLHTHGELGFSCPEYMMYVEDDDYPVYCAANKQEYSREFTRSLDILLGMNGRDHAFFNDMLTSVQLHKRLILLNVVGSLSKTPPAAISHGGFILDAVTAFQQSIYTQSEIININNFSLAELCLFASTITLQHAKEILGQKEF